MINVLNRHLSTLSELISKGEPIKINDQFTKSLEALCFYIKKNKLRIKVDCKITSVPCDQCGEHIRQGNEGRKILLNCNHNVCSKECLQTIVKRTNSLWTDYENTKCQTCNKYILARIIEDSFGGKEAFNKILADYEENRAAKFDCPLCYMTYRVDEGITLDCDHRYDKNCLATSLETAINESRVTEEDLSCPECAQPLSNFILQSIISRKTYSKYITFTTRQFVPKDDGVTVFYRCNGVDCDYIAYCDENVEVIVCENCQKRCCPKCRSDPHFGITCEENYKQIELKKKEAHDNAVDAEFKLAAKALGFKTCPHCKSMCERISGCNFMKCFSKSCGGRKNFCLLCEGAITDAQHYNHYKADGPFGKTCNTLDGKPDHQVV